MVRSGICLQLALMAAADVLPAPDAPVMSVCELSKDFPAPQGKIVAVRGVYYYGLRQECPQKCSSGPWPSFIDLAGGTDET